MAAAAHAGVIAPAATVLHSAPVVHSVVRTVAAPAPVVYAAAPAVVKTVAPAPVVYAAAPPPVVKTVVHQPAVVAQHAPVVYSAAPAVVAHAPAVLAAAPAPAVVAAPVVAKAVSPTSCLSQYVNLQVKTVLISPGGSSCCFHFLHSPRTSSKDRSCCGYTCRWPCSRSLYPLKAFIFLFQSS